MRLSVRWPAIQAQRKGLELVWSIDPNLPDRLVGGPGRLRQVLANLLGNAIKFTKAGEVGLHVNLESAAADSIQLHFRIYDTGIGIPANKINGPKYSKHLLRPIVLRLVSSAERVWG